MTSAEGSETVAPEAELIRHSIGRASECEPAVPEPVGAAVPSGNDLVLSFLDPETPSGFQWVDLSAWRDRMGMGLAIKEYLLTRYADKSPHTRANEVNLLDVLRDFLDDGFPEVTDIGILCREAIFSYEDWLRAQTHKRSRERSLWTDQVKRQRYAALMRFLDFCWATPRLRTRMPPAIDLDRNPLPFSHLETNPHRPLSDEDRQEVVEACIREIGEVTARLGKGEEIAADTTIVVPPVGTRRTKPFEDERVKLRAVIERHRRKGPSPDRVKKRDPGLARALLVGHDGRERLGSHLHFTSRSIVPFVVLLTLDSAFNPYTILNVDLDGILKEHPMDGGSRWVMEGEKKRSKNRQSRSFWTGAKDRDSSFQILRTLIHHGAFARAKLKAPLDGRLLAFWQLRGKAFASFAGRMGHKTWNRALDAFREDNGLPYFTLVNLRATAAEIVDELADGDVKVVQRYLHHEHLSTTVGHYRSEKAKARGSEKLADRIDLRERFASTDGQADFRAGEGPLDAVTSGFLCIDHKASPMPGQRRGRACDAYGACPTCPLASVDPEDAFARRRLTQLAERIEQATNRLHAERMVGIWMPRLAALKSRWLPMFSDEVARKAAALHVRPIPRIE